MESPKCGDYPNGSFYNAQTAKPQFFTRKTKEDCDIKLVNTDMPFLYQLISSKLLHSINNKRNLSKANVPPTQNEEEDYKGFEGGKSFDPQALSTVEPGKDHKDRSSITIQSKRACMVQKACLSAHSDLKC